MLISMSLAEKKAKQKVQGLQAFVLFVVNVNDNIRNLGWKESVGVKFKEAVYAEWCLKLWFESDWYIFGILLSQDGFEGNCPEKKP